MPRLETDRFKEREPKVDDKKTEIVRKIRALDIIKDPQWLEKPDEPVPLWVMFDAIIQLLEWLDPPHRPYD